MSVSQLGIALVITVASISSLHPLLGKKTHIRIETLAGFIEIIGFMFALVLVMIENSKSFRPSNVLLVFWPLVIASTAIKLRTVMVECPIDNNTHQEDGIEQCLVGAKLVLTMLVFALECVRKDAGIRLGDDVLVSFSISFSTLIIHYLHTCVCWCHRTRAFHLHEMGLLCVPRPPHFTVSAKKKQGDGLDCGTMCLAVLLVAYHDHFHGTIPSFVSLFHGNIPSGRKTYGTD